jgi:hypothetical protein
MGEVAGGAAASAAFPRLSLLVLEGRVPGRLPPPVGGDEA